jgi:pantothenate kinase
MQSAPRLAPDALVQSASPARATLLSFNMNLLPFGAQHVPSHAHKDERMACFVSLVADAQRPLATAAASPSNAPRSIAPSPYDILALQEVYASPYLPSLLVNGLCRQTRLIEQLRDGGFPHHAVCEQPSLLAMVARRVFTDSGLVIASRFPIEHVGSVALSALPPTTTSAAAASAPLLARASSLLFAPSDDPAAAAVGARVPGCLFAAVRVPVQGSAGAGNLLLVFNAHLSSATGSGVASPLPDHDVVAEHVSPGHSPASGAVSGSGLTGWQRQQIGELRCYIESVLRQFPPRQPFVVVGDFNVNALVVVDSIGTTRTSRAYSELRALLTPLVAGSAAAANGAAPAAAGAPGAAVPLLTEALETALGYHPATRPVSAATQLGAAADTAHTPGAAARRQHADLLSSLLDIASGSGGGGGGGGASRRGAARLRSQEMRHDYLFLGGGASLQGAASPATPATAAAARVERFAVPEGVLPFRFLSDHFALVVRIDVAATMPTAAASSSSPDLDRRAAQAAAQHGSPLSTAWSARVGEQRSSRAFRLWAPSTWRLALPFTSSDQALYSIGSRMSLGAFEVGALLLVVAIMPTLALLASTAAFAAAIGFVYFTIHSRRTPRASDFFAVARVSHETVAGTAPALAAGGALTGTGGPLGDGASLAPLWHAVVARSGWMPCVGPSLLLTRAYARGWLGPLCGVDADVSAAAAGPDSASDFSRAFLTFAEADRLALGMACGLGSLFSPASVLLSSALGSGHGGDASAALGIATSPAPPVVNASFGGPSAQSSSAAPVLRIGVLLHSSPVGPLLDLALLVYGRAAWAAAASAAAPGSRAAVAPVLVPVALVGEPGSLRAELDDADCALAIASVSLAGKLVACHSRKLRAIVVVPDEPFFIASAQQSAGPQGASNAANASSAPRGVDEQQQLHHQAAAPGGGSGDAAPVALAGANPAQLAMLFAASAAAGALPAGLELLATENSISLVALAEVLDHGCALAQADTKVAVSASGSSHASPRGDDLAAIVFDGRLADTAGDARDWSSSAPRAAQRDQPSYGRLLRLTHRNVARFVAQLAESGVVPPPNSVASAAAAGAAAFSSRDDSEPGGAAGAPSSRHVAAAMQLGSGVRVLLADVHLSLPERWAALCAMLCGHCAVVTRSGFAVTPVSAIALAQSAAASSAALQGASIALRPHVVFASLLPMIALRAAYDRLVSSGVSRFAAVQAAWSLLFRVAVRFRDRLLERNLDSGVARSLFFGGIRRRLFGPDARRVVVATDEVLPHRVRHFAQLLVDEVVAVVAAPSVGIIAINGVPPPRTLVRIRRDGSATNTTVPLSAAAEAAPPSSAAAVSGDVELAGPAVLGIDRDSGGFAPSGVLGAWYRGPRAFESSRARRDSSASTTASAGRASGASHDGDDAAAEQSMWSLQVLCGADAMLRPGRDAHPEAAAAAVSGGAQMMTPPLPRGAVVNAAALERAYIAECASVVVDMFVWCREGHPLVAVVVPNRPVLLELLVLASSAAAAASAAQSAAPSAGANGTAVTADGESASATAGATTAASVAGTPIADAAPAEEQPSLRDPGVLFRSQLAARIVLRACAHAFAAAGLSHEISAVHLHPHPFVAHADFAGANGCRRRVAMARYFAADIERMYAGLGLAGRPAQRVAAPFSVADIGNSTTTAAAADQGDDASSPHLATSERTAAEAAAQSSPIPPSPELAVVPNAPFAVDIGGTCAKVAFFAPAALDPRTLLPAFCTIEAPDDATAAIAEFVDPAAVTAMFAADVQQRYAAHAGRAAKVRLVCMKLPTSMVARLIQLLSVAPSSATRTPVSSAAVSAESALAAFRSASGDATPLTPPLLSTPTASSSASSTSSAPAASVPAAAAPAQPPALSATLGGKLRVLFAPQHLRAVMATGGGAFRFEGAARAQLGMRVEQVKEMESLVRGLRLLLERCPDATVFSYDVTTSAPARHKLTPDPARGAHDATAATADSPGAARSSPSSSSPASSRDLQPAPWSPYPFLLVNIGSGVSIVKCASGDGSFVRVGGSPVGGATFWGLARALTSIQSWDELREVTRIDGPGDHTKVDLLVGDIYGYNATALPAGLTVDTLASSFGKMASRHGATVAAAARRDDDGGSSSGTGGTGGGNGVSSVGAGDNGTTAGGSAGAGGIGGGGGATLGAAAGATGSSSFDRDAGSPDASPMNGFASGIAANTPLSPATIAGVDARFPSGMLGRTASGVASSAAAAASATGAMSSSAADVESALEDAASSAAQLSTVDVIRSLLMLVATNITQIAFLYARHEGVRNIVFTGGFVRGNALVWNQVTRALHYWSGGQMTAHFLKNDGYVGVIGALLAPQPAAAP